MHSELSRLESSVLKKVRKFLKCVDVSCIHQIVRRIVHKNLSETRLISIFLFFINTDTAQSSRSIFGIWSAVRRATDTPIRNWCLNGYLSNDEHTRTKRWVKKSLFYSPLQKKKIPRLEKSNNSLWCDSRKC